MWLKHGCLCLNGLCATYLKAIGGGKGVECHILRLKGGRMPPVLDKDAAEGCAEHTLAHIAACAYKHERAQGGG